MRFFALTLASCGALQLPSTAPASSANAAAASGSAAALSRRAVLGSLATAALATGSGAPAPVAAINTEILEDLPPKAKQAYLQYLPQLQVRATVGSVLHARARHQLKA